MNARDPGRMSPTTAAVVYAMTGKPAFRQQARSQMLRNDLGHYVQDSGLYAYDILYEELTAAERREFQRKALDFIKRPWNDGTRLSYALGIWGDCTDTAIEKTIAEQAPLFEALGFSGRAELVGRLARRRHQGLRLYPPKHHDTLGQRHHVLVNRDRPGRLGKSHLGKTHADVFPLPSRTGLRADRSRGYQLQPAGIARR